MEFAYVARCLELFAIITNWCVVLIIFSMEVKYDIYSNISCFSLWNSQIDYQISRGIQLSKCLWCSTIVVQQKCLLKTIFSSEISR